MSSAAATGGACVVVASAPGRVLLCGVEPGPRVSVALDRRAQCRVERGGSGIALEAKDALTKTSAGDVAELLARSPGSIAAHALDLAGARSGLRVITEWKLPAGSGVDGDSALALASAAAVARAMGKQPGPDELVRLAREAARRAGRRDEDGHHPALWGGVVLTRGTGSTLEASPLPVDPGRVEEALLLVDSGEATAHGIDPTPPRGAEGGLTEQVAAALVGGRSEELVGLLAEEAGGALGRPSGGPAVERVVELVRAAGGAARPLPRGRLVAVWAPPGARGPGRGEAVRDALKGAGLQPLRVRVDLRGLEVD